jgi:hypothetical protein
MVKTGYIKDDFMVLFLHLEHSSNVLKSADTDPHKKNVDSGISPMLVQPDHESKNLYIIKHLNRIPEISRSSCWIASS